MTFQQREYNIKGYDYEEGDYFTFTLYVKDISADRCFMYAYATYEFGEEKLTSHPVMLKIEKKEEHEYTRHPYIKGRIYS